MGRVDTQQRSYFEHFEYLLRRSAVAQGIFEVKLQAGDVEVGCCRIKGAVYKLFHLFAVGYYSFYFSRWITWKLPWVPALPSRLARRRL